MSITLDQAIANATATVEALDPQAQVLLQDAFNEAERIQRGMLDHLQEVTGRTDFTCLTTADDILKPSSDMGALGGHRARFAASCGTIYVVTQFQTIRTREDRHLVYLSVNGADDPDQEIRTLVDGPASHLEALLLKRDWLNRHQD